MSDIRSKYCLVAIKHEADGRCGQRATRLTKESSFLPNDIDKHRIS